MLSKILARLRSGRPLQVAASDRQIVEVKFEGKPILLDIAHGIDNVASLFADGTYEEPLPRFFAATIRRRPGMVLDVGANNGLYSIIACLAHPDVRVRAYEPFPPVLQVMKRNVELNRLQQRIVIEALGLSDKAGTTTLYVPVNEFGYVETSCSLEAGFLPSGSTVDVQIARLDDVIGPVRPSVLKVDIEGHEPAFFQGARRTIETHRPVVFYEVLGGAPERERAITEFKNSVGYVDYRLRTDLAILSDEVWFDTAWNHALVPSEYDPEFREIIAECGLTWIRQT